MFPAALPDSECDLIGLSFHETDVHIDMTDILLQCAAGSCYCDEAGLDRNLNALGNVEFFGLKDVPHLRESVELA